MEPNTVRIEQKKKKERKKREGTIYIQRRRKSIKSKEFILEKNRHDKRKL